MRDWWRLMDERAHQSADPVNPQRVFWELSERLPDNAILTSDSGSAANWYARDIKMRGTMRGSLSGNLATMGPGVPYAIAAKFAYPDRPVIALVGDGAMQMNGMNELLTIAKYWQRWSDPRLIVMVLANRDLNQVTWEQRAMEGDPKFLASQEVPALNMARYAELVGMRGIRVDSAADVGAGLGRGAGRRSAGAIEAITDPEVPPLPPHITGEQAKNFLSAMLHGDPDSLRMIRQSFKQKIRELIPG